MKHGNAAHNVLLTFSIAGIFAGATFLSGGACGGGGGGGYQASPEITAK